MKIALISLGTVTKLSSNKMLGLEELSRLIRFKIKPKSSFVKYSSETERSVLLSGSVRGRAQSF